MRQKLFVCIAILFCLPTYVLGDFTFSNFGRNDEFDELTGYIVGSLPDFGIENGHLGFEFTAEVTGTIESVDVAIYDFTPDVADSMLFTIWNDDEGVPGDPIWVGVANPGTVAEIVTVQSADVSGQLLTAGENYWLSSRASNGDGAYVWSWSVDGFGNAVFDITGGTDWSGGAFAIEQSAFRVNVNLESIPEPTLVFPLAIIGVFGFRRSRK